MGNYAEAESLYRQALDIRRTALGEEHPDMAHTLTYLAALYKKMGQYDKAEPLYRQALKIQRTVLGDNHPAMASSLYNLAALEILLGNPAAALENMLEAAKIDDRMITRVFSISDEQRIQKYIKTFQGNYFVLLSNFSQHYSALKAYTPRVLDVILKRKAITLELLAIRRDHILTNKHPHLESKFQELKNAQKAVSRLLVEGSGDQDQQRISLLEQQIETLEKELAAQVPQVELQQKLEQANHKVIASLLPQDSSLVEFVWYKPYDFQRNTFLSPRYLVFFLSNDAEEEIQVLDLGEASAIDELIAQYRKLICDEGDRILAERENKRNIGVIPTQQKPSEAHTPTCGQQLYETLFSPMIEKLRGRTHLIIAPDGNITLLPFEILPQPNGRYVVEDFELHYVDSGRDLLRFEYREEPLSPPLMERIGRGHQRSDGKVL